MKCQIFGILLFLRSLCSQLLYNLKRSAYVFVSLLDYSQLSRLKIRLICFLFSLFLLFCSPALGINKVFADETPTPNPTFAPIYVTATPRPHQFSSCPEYADPVGYGSVTPSANWMLWCSQCLPFDGYSQPLPEGWPTPQPEVVITQIPTLNPGNTDELRITSTNVSFFKLVGGQDYITSHEETERYIKVEDWMDYSDWINWTIYSWNDIDNAQYVQNFDIRIVFQHQAMSEAYCGYTLKFGIELKSLNTDNIIFTFTGDIEGEYNTKTDDHTIWFYQGRTCDAGTASVEFNMQVEVEESRGEGRQDWYITEKRSNMLGSNATQVEFEWYKGGTDTGPVIVDSYCNEIESQTEFDMQGIFDFPTIGIADCIEIGGQTLGFGWLHTLFGEELESVPEELTLPGFNLCLIPINFGAINIFGLSIDLDAMAVVMAGVTLLRYIFRR